jgi:hypothetical protein
MGWAIFWAISSPTHLVTLVVLSDLERCFSKQVQKVQFGKLRLTRRHVGTYVDAVLLNCNGKACTSTYIHRRSHFMSQIKVHRSIEAYVPRTAPTEWND